MTWPTVYRLREVRTGKEVIAAESVLIKNPCGNCGHGWVKHIHEGEKHPWDGAEYANHWRADSSTWRPKCSPFVRGAESGGCGCGGYVQKYEIIGRYTGTNKSILKGEPILMA